LTSIEKFVFERDSLVFDYLIYLEPVERFNNWSNVMKFRSFGDSTSSRVYLTLLCHSHHASCT